MPRRATIVQCNAEAREELERWTRGRSTEARLVERAKIVLLCMKGQTNKDIAMELETSKRTVSKWRLRFAAGGLPALLDQQRPGAPEKYGPETRKLILKALETPPPKGQASWDGKSLARAVGASEDAVWRFLRKEGIQLQRRRSWCVSTDKQFAAKSADIIGLYLNPPNNALVLCVDEKPSIQVLERAHGYVKTSSGKVVMGYKSTYKRHGTLNLFAALNVASGVVKTKTTAQKKRPDFQAFLDDVTMDVPSDREIHIILDNYCTHKRNEDWLAEHPNVFFHYTPTSASWLNQVEIWFGILSRKALRNASFGSVEELRQAIEDFIAVYHEGAQPFVWRKREVHGSQLRNTITNLCN